MTKEAFEKLLAQLSCGFECDCWKLEEPIRAAYAAVGAERDQWKRDAEKYSARLTEVVADRDAVLAERDTFKVRIDELEEEGLSLTAKVAELVAERDALKQELCDSQYRHGECIAEYEALKSRIEGAPVIDARTIEMTERGVPYWKHVGLVHAVPVEPMSTQSTCPEIVSKNGAKIDMRSVEEKEAKDSLLDARYIDLIKDVDPEEARRKLEEVAAKQVEGKEEGA